MLLFWVESLWEQEGHQMLAVCQAGSGEEWFPTRGGARAGARSLLVRVHHVPVHCQVTF
jgi:hypothetical protein